MMRRLFAVGVLVLAAGAWRARPEVQLKGFHTPSGNIACLADNESGEGRWELRCDVGEHDWNGPRARNCDLDSGDALSLGATGRPAWSCHGDTVLHSGERAEYGTTWHAGPFNCAIAREGVTCRNRGGHGFLLSRARYRVW
jgi:hypothetical protein